MGRNLISGQRALPDHATPSGDAVVAQLVISLHASGAMSIQGPVADTQWCLLALDHAAHSIRSNARPRNEIIVPSKDVDL